MVSDGHSPRKISSTIFLPIIWNFLNYNPNQRLVLLVYPFVEFYGVEGVDLTLTYLTRDISEKIESLVDPQRRDQDEVIIDRGVKLLLLPHSLLHKHSAPPPSFLLKSPLIIPSKSLCVSFYFN